MDRKRAVLFVNGELEDPKGILDLLQGDDFLIAVDGGLRHIRQAGRMPDVLMGDLDSISAPELEEMEAAGVQILRYPVEKDDTDLELALMWAQAQGYTVLRIIGALGGRIDQQTGNLLLLGKPGLEQVDLRIIQTGLEILPVHGRVEIQGHAGDTLSLLPLLGLARGVVTEGLYYPLRSETLYPYQTRGISNVMLGETAAVQLEEGTLLCMHLSKSIISDVRH